MTNTPSPSVPPTPPTYPTPTPVEWPSPSTGYLEEAIQRLREVVEDALEDAGFMAVIDEESLYFLEEVGPQHYRDVRETLGHDIYDATDPIEVEYHDELDAAFEKYRMAARAYLLERVWPHVTAHYCGTPTPAPVPPMAPEA